MGKVVSRLVAIKQLNCVETKVKIFVTSKNYQYLLHRLNALVGMTSPFALTP